MKTVLLISLVAALAAGGALADTFVWGYPDIPLQEPFAVDMGVAFTEIVAVDIHLSGFSGGQHGYCQHPDGNDPMNFPFEVDVDLEGATTSFILPYMEDYDLTFPLELTGQPDWSFLEDGLSAINIEYRNSGSYDLQDCYPTGYDEMTATTFEIIVTAGTVPVETATWTTLKSLYR